MGGRFDFQGDLKNMEGDESSCSESDDEETAHVSCSYLSLGYNSPGQRVFKLGGLFKPLLCTVIADY